ncbi:VanZ family protein [Desulforamulus reducens MI-1]|uniref:VanZ family protein n=1 Tax=Desulforamulus reducens (strain ATCC BAA-1160 / DSM 100696 / MI-1) TaxID=349161 RepID=A4J8W8_DESRM|nr:VanZ family protein [Desulforamulus reducens]ABO51521.1 VanZ family protein [Desulforamulus reducens MI-1]
MNKRNYTCPYIKFLSWAAVLLWMALIFNLSSQVAEQSNQLSTGIKEVIVKTVEKVAPKAEFDIDDFNHILRKNAHFFAYLVLGILVLNALKTCGVTGYPSIALALGICILYAMSDEVHQLFVPGRGGQVKDVIIDSAGASVGVGVYWVVDRLVKGR